MPQRRAQRGIPCASSYNDDKPRFRDILLAPAVELDLGGIPAPGIRIANTIRKSEEYILERLRGAAWNVNPLAVESANCAEILKHMTIQTIGHDKLNQLRTLQILKDAEGLKAQMKKQAELLRPKFELVLRTLEKELAGTGLAQWKNPKGGYFVALDTMDGCAKETIRLAKEAGVTMTGAGATFPYKNDPRDRNIRIAPTFPPLEELAVAMELFCLCVKLAAVRKLMA